ncbi:MAG: cytochrome c biogenesis protein CcdA [Chloroflexi bacterium]|nr:cytochrome c biogenesis protein CcdA [Chloroflexota bacterium]
MIETLAMVEGNRSKLIWALRVVLLSVGLWPAIVHAQNPPPAVEGLPVDNLPLMAALAFVAGVLSFLSPCTVPVLPAYFAFTFPAERKQVVTMTTAFFLGLATTFSLLGGSATLLGSFLRQHLGALTTLGGVVIIVFGILTILGKGFSGLPIANQPSNSLWGTYLFGATFAIGWTSCIGPILGGILILAAQTATVYQGMLFMFVYALGLGLPLILVSTFLGRADQDSRAWRLLRGRSFAWRVAGRELTLHSTELVSGLLLIGLGGLMISGYITFFNRYLPPDIQVWFLDIEERILGTLAGS